MNNFLNFFSPQNLDGLNQKQIPVSVEKFLPQPLILSAITFVIMSLFFVIDILINQDWLLTVGIMQVIVSLLITVFNIALVLTAVQISLNYPYVSKLVFKKTCILFVNIPIAISYICIINSTTF